MPVLKMIFGNPLVYAVVLGMYAMYWADGHGYARRAQEERANTAALDLRLATLNALQGADLAAAEAKREKQAAEITGALPPAATEAPQIAKHAKSKGIPPAAQPAVWPAQKPPATDAVIVCREPIPAGTIAKINAIN